MTAGAGGAAAALEGCETDLRYLNQISGWQGAWPAAWSVFGTADRDARAAMVARWADAPAALQADMEALRRGIANGTSAPKPVVRRILDQTDGLAAALAAGAPGADEAPQDDETAAWRTLFNEEIGPAIDRYRKFLRNDYLPYANDRIGLFAIDDSGRCFENAVRFWTSLDLSAEEIETRGRAILEETTADFLAHAKTPRRRLKAALDHYRAPYDGGPVTGDDLIAVSEAAIARAREAMPRQFRAYDIAPIQIVEMAAHRRSSSPAGYYLPAAGGSASYVINPSRAAERRLMAEVIAFHEAIPGHHLNSEVTARSGGGGRFNSGYAEGWAIYAEYLAVEAGLYSSDYDRTGMIAKHLWAASRLVIEPGIHLHGWSRDQAIAFMREHSAMPEAEIALEIDRYIAMPAQSLSYMLGYLEFRDMRRRAEAALGEKFDIREFHHVVMAGGVRELAAVAADVERWIEAGGG
ncbi:MAG: hypothetical protein Tsb0010_04770 [Parvularculaceae bacterium]